ncbi:unnamed protein product, partial [Brenthis ino]
MIYILRFLHFLICILLVLKVCANENVIKNDDDRDDDTDDATEETLEIPMNSTGCSRKRNILVHEIKKASISQFPFMAALMSSRNEYLCAGSVVSNGVILTTAQCTEFVSYVLLNTTTDKKNDNTLHVIKSEKFPTFIGSNIVKDVALVYTEKFNTTMATKINISNYTSVKNLNEIEALGFGLNAEIDTVKELQYVGLETKPKINNPGDVIEGYLDCIDTKVLTCFKDKGGPAIFNNELVGIIISGQNECTREITSTYALNKLMVTAIPIYTFKAWFDEKIAKYIEKEDAQLEVFPKKPITRKATVRHVMTHGSAGGIKDRLQPYILLLPLWCFRF